MKIFNLAAKSGPKGKHLDLHFTGVIDGGWERMDQDSAYIDDVIRQLNEHHDAATVHAYINSIGGSMFAGIALYNALAAHPGEVTCIVQGLAASAASLIAMAGNKTVMRPGSMMMIHSPGAGVYGNARELRQTADLLDKAQEGLVAIYEQKTGKSRDELHSLLNDETWMTADEAVAAGFANAIEAGHEEPDGDEDENGEEPAGPEEPTALGDLVVWNEVAFPKTALPARIVAMAKPVPVITVAGASSPEMAPAVAEAARASLGTQTPTAVTPIVNRAYLAEKHPEIVAVLLEEGRAAGVAAERARLKAIDELPALGCGELVAAAKYGEQPVEAPALAVQIVKAQKGVGAELLAARALESQPLSNLGAPAPDQTAKGNEARIIAAMSLGYNARLGRGANR